MNNNALVYLAGCSSRTPGISQFEFDRQASLTMASSKWYTVLLVVGLHWQSVPGPGVKPYIPQCFTSACGQPQECSELLVQGPLQIASSEWLLQGSGLYPQHVLNQEAPANVQVHKHTAGSRLCHQKMGSGRRGEERKCLEWILY